MAYVLKFDLQFRLCGKKLVDLFHCFLRRSLVTILQLDHSTGSNI